MKYYISEQLFETISDMSTQIYLNISEKVHGKVVVYYNKIADCLEIKISNRALNIEDFRMNFPTFQSTLQIGTSAKIITSKVLTEYQNYVDIYIWKRGF